MINDISKYWNRGTQNGNLYHLFVRIFKCPDNFQWPENIICDDIVAYEGSIDSGLNQGGGRSRLV